MLKQRASYTDNKVLSEVGSVLHGSIKEKVWVFFLSSPTFCVILGLFGVL